MSTTPNYLKRNNPLMQELWAVKAQINAEANYSVDEIVRRMREKYPQTATGELRNQIVVCEDLVNNPVPTQRSS